MSIRHCLAFFAEAWGLIFTQCLKMSISGGMMILAILAIRALAINRLPKKTFLALWGIALTRLLIPYSLPSAFSVYSLLGRLAALTGKMHTEAMLAEPNLTGTDMPGYGDQPATWPNLVPVPNTGATPFAPGTQTAASFASDAQTATSFTFDARTAASTAEPYAIIWAVGVLACSIFFIVAYWKCRREFRESLPVDNGFLQGWLKTHRLRRRMQIRQSDKISAPLTYGVFRPVILLPKRTDWADEEALTYMLAHEYIHIRRFDAVTKLMLTAALCVHWFNPAVWGMYLFANRDIELGCDEAVVRMFGEHTKSAYATTLIRMEEVRSGLRPLCNHFSKHTIEERIIAIMKMKKTSWIAALTAFSLIAGVTAAFATTAQAQEDGQNPKKSDQKLGSQANTAYDESTLMSYTDSKDGETYYSQDGGKTWILEADWEFNSAASGWNNVDWWTAEEYAAWLEQEKAALQSIIGERGWTPSTGWFTWTQEMAEEAIAQYEQTLKDIQSGMKISKPTADGDTMIQYGYDPNLQETTTDITTVLGSVAIMGGITDNTVTTGNGQTLTPELLADYKAYGMVYDETKKAFYFNGKLVRYFFDGYSIPESGVATIYDYVNKDGIVDVHTLRQATQNADGSMDLGGKLIGIEEYSQEEFDSRFFMNPTTAQEATSAFGFVGSTGGTTFEERFAKYKDFGITYAEARGQSGRGNVYLNGQLVSHFADVAPDGSAFTFASAEEGGMYVRTDYDNNGKLIGVQEMLPEDIEAEKEAQQYAREEIRAEYERTKETLAPYLPFGLDCDYDINNVYESSLTMSWQGKPVRSLFDAERELFIANSLGDGGLGEDAVDLEAVYDSNGNLTGLKIAVK